MLVHCLPRLSDAEVAAFAPLLPVLQAGLLSPQPRGAHGEEEGGAQLAFLSVYGDAAHTKMKGAAT